ncbi:MAG: hypothetical protein LUI60_06550 [Clostridia bacterium]|nr:hypothetical protein [Clostridia bacterium]
MAENENVMQPEVSQPETKKKKDNGGFKEWRRKQIVNLKRKPQNIPMVFLFLGCAIYLVCLTSFSKSVIENYNSLQEWAALGVFVCTLFSMLVIVSYMRIFPKHKKPSIAMMVVTYVFLALMIFMDIVIINEITTLRAENFSNPNVVYDSYDASADNTSIAISIVHIVIEAIAAVLLATMPLWKKLLMKINTKKEIESASSNMGAIDLQGEE